MSDTDKKLRVSAKQRLNIIKQNLKVFENSRRELEDYVRFVDDTEEALNSKLDPRDK